MGIWYRRPLFWLCTVWMAATVAGVVLSGTDGRGMLWSAVVCLGLAVLAGAAALWRHNTAHGRRGGFRRPRPWVGRVLRWGALSLVCAAAALLVTGWYFARQVTPTSFPLITIESMDDGGDDATGAAVEAYGEAEDVSACWMITATVTERLGGGGQITAYGLTLHSVNGTPVGSWLHPARAYLYCAYVGNMQPGQTITAAVLPASLAQVTGTSAASLTGDGYSLALLSEQERDVTIDTEEDTHLLSRLWQFRRQWAAMLDTLVGRAGGGLPSALLLGERGGLAEDVRRDFARAGLSHMLAISGLHMTLLFGLLAWLLRFLCLPRWIRAVVPAMISVLYLCLLGFPPSATRAVIMLGMTYLSWLCAAQADPLTSLGLAGALILGFSPCTVFDAGFWMSFSATLGLITVMPLWSEGLRAMRRRISSGGTKAASPMICMLRKLVHRSAAILTGLVTGVVAMTFSLWITALTVGQISPLSPLATLLMTPLCGCALVLSLVAVPLRSLWIGKTLVTPALQGVCGWMKSLAGALSEPYGATVSLAGGGAEMAIRVTVMVMTVALLVLLGIRMKKAWRWTVLLPMVCGWVVLGILLFGATNRSDVVVTYLRPSTASEALVLTRGREAVICDLSDGSHTALRNCVLMAEEEGATEISVLMLTHYHSRMTGTLWHILSAEMVRALWLPRPERESDYYLMLSCMEKAAYCHVPVYVYAPGEALTVFDDIRIRLRTTSIKRSTQPVMLLTLMTEGTDGDNGQQITFCGGAVFESDLAGAAEAAIRCSQTVIYGAHGPKIKAAYPCCPSDRLTTIGFANEATAAYLDADSLPEPTPTLILGQMRVRIKTHIQ